MKTIITGEEYYEALKDATLILKRVIEKARIYIPSDVFDKIVFYMQWEGGKHIFSYTKIKQKNFALSGIPIIRQRKEIT